MHPKFALLEIVKLNPERRSELAGLPAEITPDSLGTIVEMGKATLIAPLSNGNRSVVLQTGIPIVDRRWVYWVEFIDDAGRTLALEPFEEADLQKA